MKIEHFIRYMPRAVGLMETENLFRYPALAVGLKPSARRGEARLRGLERIIYSKTIISVYTPLEAGALRDVHPGSAGVPARIPGWRTTSWERGRPRPRAEIAEALAENLEAPARLARTVVEQRPAARAQ